MPGEVDARALTGTCAAPSKPMAEQIFDYCAPAPAITVPHERLPSRESRRASPPPDGFPASSVHHGAFSGGIRQKTPTAAEAAAQVKRR
jgi:hypothetical protein